MRWLFHYPKRISFYPPDLEFPGLGGSEASLVLVTRALASRGHHVDVYNCCWRPGKYEGVDWHLTSSLESATQPDVEVAVRFGEANRPSGAQRKIFWMLDDRVRGACQFAASTEGAVVVSSEAQKMRLQRAGCSVAPVNISLPVETWRYSKQLPKERACIFCSMPNRGLDVALKIWPAIRSACPDLELWVTSGWQLWGYTSTEAADRWEQIVGLGELAAGVRLFKTVSREHLISLQLRAALSLYPCRFPEMFCLAAAECSTAGTPVVTSAIGAMLERVENNRTGILIDGSIDDADVQREFIRETINLLSDHSRLADFSRNCREAAGSYSVDGVAEAWERLAGY